MPDIRKMSTSTTVCAFLVGCFLGALVVATIMVGNDYAVTPHSGYDAGQYDAHWLDPGIDCLNRETKAAQAQTQQLWQKQAELEAEIDGMTGAYTLREQLESEPEDKAIKHAFAVLKDDTILQQSIVARKFLRDRDAVVGSWLTPSKEEMVEHEVRKRR
jgi:hypothetical protein